MRSAAISLFFIVALASGVRLGVAEAQPTFAGIYVDEDRQLSCTGGSTFTQIVWAQIPEPGLVYLTLRFSIPPNVEAAARAKLNPAVDDLIVTEFPDGSVEWNFFFTGCPTGWIRVFEQDMRALDAQPSLLAIDRAASLVRTCDFQLDTLESSSSLQVNDPDCETIPVETPHWGRWKGRYSFSASSVDFNRSSTKSQARSK